MRNYFTIFFSELFAYDSFGVLVGQVKQAGVDQASAHAQAEAQIPIFVPPGGSSQIVDMGEFYVLANKFLLCGYLCAINTGDQTYNTLTAISAAYGMDPTVSPREQNVYPWNGKAKKRHHPVGKFF